MATPYRHLLAAASALAAAAALPGAASAQAPRDEVVRGIEARHAHYAGVARQIWSFAEVGFQETRSSALLQQELKSSGFTVETGVAGMPTAFVATYGSGKPVIGLFAEFDALPGMSQDTTAEHKSLGGAAGHACGHHLLGTASLDAAVAVKEWLARTKRSGTVRLYGTPAEEGGSGKVYMVRGGLFDGVDVVLGWHPGAENSASPGSTLANMSGKFRFRGVAAHAAASPDRGRSALDGVEAMDHMVNMMREHVPQTTRIHYVITDGGRAPNVVPDFAEVYYYVRSPDPQVVKDVWARVVKAAEGAALGTGTAVTHEVTGGVYNVLPNETLARALHANLERLGGIRYTPAELAFAEQIRKTLDDPRVPLASAAAVAPFAVRDAEGSASSDVGDISWTVPVAELSTATWVPGTPAHSWQAVAAGGTDIGARGMTLAAKTMAATAVDLFLDPSIIRTARAEFERKRGAGFRYTPLLGDRKPALDYRK
jgi:aminobenzoyl-glutamate utilization protein B